MVACMFRKQGFLTCKNCKAILSINKSTYMICGISKKYHHIYVVDCVYMEAKKSIFVETFGETPIVKVLDFFLTFDSFDYSKSSVSEETGVSRITLDKIWEDFVQKKIIVKTREIGRAEMYKLNKESSIAKVLSELNFKLASSFAEEEIPKIRKKV